MPLVKSNLESKLKTHFQDMKNIKVDDRGEANAKELATVIVPAGIPVKSSDAGQSTALVQATIE